MDLTLRDYLRIADGIHNDIDKYGICLSTDQLNEKILQLQSNIKIIQSVSKRMSDISNITNRLLTNKTKSTKKPVSYIDPYPDENDHVFVRTMTATTKKITDETELPVKYVLDVIDIPITEIYYVTNLQQFAINLCGVVIKGNVGNILEYTCENTAKCEYSDSCKSFSKGYKCAYYHDPSDYIKLGIAIPPNHTRNFTVGSWLYSTNKTCRTYFTRHVGSLHKLDHDLRTLKKMQYIEEIATRESQLMHDILIYMILNSKGYIEKYPHWQTFK